jgi:hypothetical protein
MSEEITKRVINNESTIDEFDGLEDSLERR